MNDGRKKTFLRNLLLLAMAWAAASGTVWAGEKPAKPESAAEPYFIFRKSDKDHGLPAYLNREESAGIFAKVLTLMGEPRLPALAKNPNLVVYRFTIFPAWGNYFSVRVQQEGARFRLWASHFAPRVHALAEHKEAVLSETDSERLCGLIQRLDLFKMLSEGKPMFTDGEVWLVEGVVGGKYNVVEYDSVSGETQKRGLSPLYEFCKFLIANDGLKATPKSFGGELFRR